MASHEDIPAEPSTLVAMHSQCLGKSESAMLLEQ